jgi:hypothetical protein
MRVNVEQASKRVMRKPTRLNNGEGRRRGTVGLLKRRTKRFGFFDSAGVVTTACLKEETTRNTGSPGDECA